MVEEIREEFHIWERAKRGRRLDLARELALGGGGCSHQIADLVIVVASFSIKIRHALRVLLKKNGKLRVFRYQLQLPLVYVTKLVNINCVMVRVSNCVRAVNW
jgi:hypothetical protein